MTAFFPAWPRAVMLAIVLRCAWSWRTTGKHRRSSPERLFMRLVRCVRPRGTSSPRSSAIAHVFTGGGRCAVAPGVEPGAALLALTRVLGPKSTAVVGEPLAAEVGVLAQRGPDA